MPEMDIFKKSLSRRIAGEIVISDNHTDSIKKWREIFNITQRELADEMGVMPSVISDYESNRRKNPGLGIIKNMINAMLSIDQKRGNEVINGFTQNSNTTIFDSIIDTKEFTKPIGSRYFIKRINGKSLTDDIYNDNLEGYIIIDSKKAATSISIIELLKLQRLFSNKIIIFTDANTGKLITSMFKLVDIKPGMILLHGIVRNINDLATRVCKAEEIPLGVSSIASIDKLKEELKGL